MKPITKLHLTVLKIRKRRCNSNDDAELQPFFRKHVFWQTQIALLQAFCQVQVSLWGFAAQSSKYFWNRCCFIVRLCSRTAALYASRGIASRHDCLGPRLPLFFPDSHYTFAILDVTDPGFRRCAIPSGDARVGDGRAY